MYFAKAKHAVAKDSLKIVRTFHWRKLVKAPDSLQNQLRPRKLAKVTAGSHPSTFDAVMDFYQGYL